MAPAAPKKTTTWAHCESALTRGLWTNSQARSSLVCSQENSRLILTSVSRRSAMGITTTRRSACRSRSRFHRSPFATGREIFSRIQGRRADGSDVDHGRPVILAVPLGAKSESAIVQHHQVGACHLFLGAHGSGNDGHGGGAGGGRLSRLVGSLITAKVVRCTPDFSRPLGFVFLFRLGFPHAGSDVLRVIRQSLQLRELRPDGLQAEGRLSGLQLLPGCFDQPGHQAGATLQVEGVGGVIDPVR